MVQHKITEHFIQCVRAYCRDGFSLGSMAGPGLKNNTKQNKINYSDKLQDTSFRTDTPLLEAHVVQDLTAQRATSFLAPLEGERARPATLHQPP